MAKLNSYNTYGLETACLATPQVLSSVSKTASLTADLTGGKDPFTVLINVPADAVGNHMLICKSADGGKDKEIPVTTGYMNVIRLSSKGIKKPDGTADFVFSTDITSINALDVSMCIIKSAEVESH